MEDLTGKINIGTNREIAVALHKNKELLVICRFYTVSELETKSAAFPFTSICLNRKCVTTLIEHMAEVKSKLTEMAMGMPLSNYKVALGQNLFVTLDADSYTVQVRRYWMSDTGLKPTRTGVAMNATEMDNLLKVLEDFSSRMTEEANE